MKYVDPDGNQPIGVDGISIAEFNRQIETPESRLFKRRCNAITDAVIAIITEGMMRGSVLRMRPKSRPGLAARRQNIKPLKKLNSATKSGKYNTSVYEIETQTGINRGGRQTQAGDIKARHDYENGKPVRRVDYDHAHGNIEAPHVVDKHANPNNPLKVNTSKPRPPEPGEYLSPVLSNPRTQGGVYKP